MGKSNELDIIIVYVKLLFVQSLLVILYECINPLATIKGAYRIRRITQHYHNRQFLLNFSGGIGFLRYPLGKEGLRMFDSFFQCVGKVNPQALVTLELIPGFLEQKTQF